jgi:hypothetical protein
VVADGDGVAFAGVAFAGAGWEEGALLLPPSHCRLLASNRASNWLHLSCSCFKSPTRGCLDATKASAFSVRSFAVSLLMSAAPAPSLLLPLPRWLGVIPNLGPGEMYLGFWLNFRGHWNILRQPNILSLLFALLALAGLVDTVVLPSSSSSRTSFIVFTLVAVCGCLVRWIS